MESADAWLLKMHAISRITTFDNPRFDELLGCARNAIVYSDKEVMESMSYSVLSSLVKLGNKALDSNKAQEALEYANKALDLNAESADAWLLKMYAISNITQWDNPRTDELLSCGKNAIKHSEKILIESMSYSVWSFVANLSVGIMDTILKEHSGQRGLNELNSIIAICKIKDSIHNN